MGMAGVRGTDFKVVGAGAGDEGVAGWGEDLRKLHGWNLGPTDCLA